MSETKTPRSFWPFGIIIFFILAILFIATFIVWAVHQREDLVAVNYYDNEVRYQEQLDKMNRSLPLQSQVIVVYDPVRQNIVVTLPTGRLQTSTGRIHLYRPADERLDCELALNLDADGLQRLDAKRLAHGLWKVRVLWSVAGKEYFFDRTIIVTHQT